jgi:hypothetical protein
MARVDTTAGESQERMGHRSTAHAEHAPSVNRVR